MGKYRRVNSLKKISNGRKVKKYIDTKESVITYFRGVYKKGTNKFEPYNDKYFKDLYFEIKRMLPLKNDRELFMDISPAEIKV